MNAAKVMLLGTAVAILSGCAAVRTLQKGDRIATLNPGSVAAAPAQWDGRQVEMIGLLVWEPENLALYQSYGAYCRRGEQTAIYVDWSKWPGVSRADSRRQVVVRGTFRNGVGAPTAGGGVILTSAAPGPGPLEPGAVVRWLSPPMKPCPSALP